MASKGSKPSRCSRRCCSAARCLRPRISPVSSLPTLAPPGLHHFATRFPVPRQYNSCRLHNRLPEASPIRLRSIRRKYLSRNCLRPIRAVFQRFLAEFSVRHAACFRPISSGPTSGSSAPPIRGLTECERLLRDRPNYARDDDGVSDVTCYGISTCPWML